MNIKIILADQLTCPGTGSESNVMCEELTVLHCEVRVCCGIIEVSVKDSRKDSWIGKWCSRYRDPWS